MERFFVGIDGGATKTVVRMETVEGELLGETTTGPANIRLSPDEAWQSIQTGFMQILTPHHLTLEQIQPVVVIGIAGCEVPSAYQTFLQRAAVLSTLSVVSDAYTACFGAHAGEDGSIIIIGSGAVGFQIDKGHTTKISGWGFPHDDEGSGAWLGLMAMRHTLRCLDGRENTSALSEAVKNHFHQDDEQLITWANEANATRFAQLAPIVIEQAKQQQTTACELMKRAASAIDDIDRALRKKQLSHQLLACTLMGGIAGALQPFLNDQLLSRIQKPKMTPAQGALLLARKTFA